MSAPLEDQGFERIAVADGVRAYKGSDEGAVQVAAEGVLQASPQEVRRALLDYPSQVGHIGRLSETQILWQDEKTMLVYQHLNLPVISDRDYNLLVAWGEEGETLWIGFCAVSDGGRGRRDGIVRVLRHEGSWQLRPIEGGRATFARFRSDIDLGGWLPLWMVRGRVAKELPGLFAELNRWIPVHRLEAKRGRGGAR